MAKKGWAFWLSFLLSVGFLYLFFRGADLGDMGRAAAEANYTLALPAVLSYFAGVWLRAVRWRLLLTPLGRFGPHRLFVPIVISFALNNLLPGRVGLWARAYLLGERERVSKLAGGTTVVVDQLFDGLALLFLAAVASLFVPLPGWARPLVAGVAGLYGGLLFLLWMMSIFPQAVRRLLRPLQKVLPGAWQGRVAEWTDLSLGGLGSLRRPDRLLLMFLLSVGVWLMEAGLFYFLALSFRLDLPFYALLLAVSIAYLALILPSLPGGVGPFEYFGKQSLLLFGVRDGVATAYMGIVHLTLLVPVTALGLGLLWWQRRPQPSRRSR